MLMLFLVKPLPGIPLPSFRDAISSKEDALTRDAMGMTDVPATILSLSGREIDGCIMLWLNPIREVRTEGRKIPLPIPKDEDNEAVAGRSGIAATGANIAGGDDGTAAGAWALLVFI